MDYVMFAQLLGDVGFPVAITIYLLLNMEAKIERLESTIHTLAESKESDDMER
ncbi:YvrJ family protein [Halobacillus salinus]|uniref:YvrJ family protein n=1 Tax=Halobacillus salinus TaxID=192814 RepID=A0A4Z0GVM1_9BACI|nr:YvrJ family protein [Halobacillus salinus]TGB01312.1 YvrJ family protein [Halobacillus salinus]